MLKWRSLTKQDIPMPYPVTHKKLDKILIIH